MEQKKCPYCGELIAAKAKKCRYCGEWLTESVGEEIMVAQPAEVAPAPVQYADPNQQNYPTVNPNYPLGNPQYPNPNQNYPVNNMQPGIDQQPVAMPVGQQGQNIQSIGGQPIVVNVVNQQTVEQNVEQTQTVVVSGGGSGSAPDWIYGEMWLIAAGIGFALKSWWWFLGIGVIGSALLLVPFIGAVMCVLLGIGWGILAAAIGAAFWSTSAAWVLGILVGGGAIYGHLEARKANMDEDDD